MTLYRWSTTSWWTQVILSVVSGVTLFFANAVTGGGALATSPVVNGLFFSSAGLFFSFASICQTWRRTRLAAEIRLRKIEATVIPSKLQSNLRSGIVINLAGMAAALVSAEQIVGLLIARVLSSKISFITLLILLQVNHQSPVFVSSRVSGFLRGSTGSVWSSVRFAGCSPAGHFHRPGEHKHTYSAFCKPLFLLVAPETVDSMKRQLGCPLSWRLRPCASLCFVLLCPVSAATCCCSCGGQPEPGAAAGQRSANQKGNIKRGALAFLYAAN